MKIKKLSMEGFKSFMDRTEIPFSTGLSAVVGPNGCGKSNIVEAIRWAMGEQSPKQLRGRNMADVIFNGAGEFKPQGMAEVTIVLENGDGSFPTEYANEHEISVTRRLYRSGESEYLLNGVQCRLKDVQELFMDTGLGNKAYSIIGQGRIGAIVDQKPEETRIMLEEAAGITKYKKKEVESRRKMELTRRNLRRVEDILVEVQSQMRSLKRQASKARRFKSIGEEIQRLELVLSSNSYHELKEESGNRKRSTEDLIQREVAMTAEYSAVLARIESMNLELEEKDSEITSVRNSYLDVKDRFNRKESALESLAGEKRMQEEMEDRLNHEKEDINKRILTLEEEMTGLGDKADKLKQGSEALEEEISLVEQRMESRGVLLNEIREEYERTRTRLNSDATREVGLNQESGYLNKRIDEIKDKRTRLENEKEDVTGKMEELLRASQQKNETREALARKLDDIENAIQEGEGACEELARIAKGVEADLKSAETELNISRTKLSSLRSLTDNFEGYKVGVRTIMKASDLNARNEGRILGLVADVIQVEPRYELAVETVLADKLQYIIVEDQDDGKEAVEYLKSRAKGRSSFISLNALNGHNGVGKGNGFPLLRDLVNVPDSYRQMIDSLLGDTALVQNLDQAISTWNNNGKDHSLVTPEGDMVDKRGIISGGKLANSPHSLLARKREIKEIEEKLTGYSKAVGDLTSKIEGINHEMDGKRKSLDYLREERTSCNDKLNDLDNSIFRVSHELDQLEKLSQRISEDIEKATGEQSRHRDALGKIESELRKCEANKRNQEEYLLRKEVELKESEEEYDEIRNELAKLKMNCSLSQEEERGILREIERIEDFSEEAQERQRKIKQEILGCRERQQESLHREEALREELKGFYGKLEKAEEMVRLTEQGRNSFHATIREEEKRSEALREELDLLREKVSRAKMEQSEIGFKMNSLIELIRERSNHDLSAIYTEYLVEEFSKTETREKLEHQKNLKERLGEVNLTAIQEHEALKERIEFIQRQREDLLKSIDSISQAIRKINRTCLERFMQTFEEANQKIKQVFPILFNGGTASLKLTDETKPLESGVLVEVHPPGKKVLHMGLLSGGEKALVAMALLFAIYLIKPSPFCLLDEVDAPLDEANIDRFNNLLQEIKKYSQVLMVTHNRRSMEIVDSLYGVTMEKAGVSKMVAVNLRGIGSNN
ncbi:MAG: chromosome segregation protein SMC [Deltaproteobacteria bacterium]|nr:chromosome segregation protein SMC [Deltaproteobacteria bacterium]